MTRALLYSIGVLPFFGLTQKITGIIACIINSDVWTGSDQARRRAARWTRTSEREWLVVGVFGDGREGEVNTEMPGGDWASLRARKLRERARKRERGPCRLRLVVDTTTEKGLHQVALMSDDKNPDTYYRTAPTLLHYMRYVHARHDTPLLQRYFISTLRGCSRGKRSGERSQEQGNSSRGRISSKTTAARQAGRDSDTAGGLWNGLLGVGFLEWMLASWLHQTINCQSVETAWIDKSPGHRLTLFSFRLFLPRQSAPMKAWF